MTLTYAPGKAGKIHISIDGEYSMTVDADFWFSLNYTNGCEIDDRQLSELESAINLRRAYNKALSLLASRDHSGKELYDKLCRENDRECASAAVERVRALGLIDDEAFARRFAAELSRKGFGSKKINGELRRRGIEKELADELSENCGMNSLQQISELLEKKFKGRLADENGRRRTFNALVRMGYDFSDIRSAMNDFSENTADGADNI